MEKIIIIKVGSSLMISARNRVDRKRVAHIIGQLGKLKAGGVRPVLVVSGAVACGRGVFPHLKATDQETRQMLAGAGQAVLTTAIQAIAQRQRVCISQLLLTKEDMQDPVRRQRLHRILTKTINADCIPLINENDAVALNSFGGNDFLAQEVASCLHADAVVMLTNVPGVMDFSCQRVISQVRQGHDISRHFVSTRSATGVGGIQSKVHAAQTLQNAGIPTVIADGRESDVLVRLLVHRESMGTVFPI